MRHAGWIYAFWIIGCSSSTTTQSAADASGDVACAGGVNAAELPAAATVTLSSTGSSVAFAVQRGGGSVQGTSWTLGKAPVDNVLGASSAGALCSTLTVRATLAEPYATQPFGDVNDFLTAQKNDGSTEDCAFSPEGKLVMGVPGGLIQLDESGKSSAMPLSGDALVKPLGLYYDNTGTLWVADSDGHALRSVAPGGKVSTVITSDGTQDLSMPNDVVSSDGKSVYFTDSCLGELFFVKDGKIIDTAKFDLATEGGANGVALDPSGKALWVTTENTALLCQTKGVPLQAPISGLYRFELTDNGFGKRTDIATNQGLFGDGLTFDSEGNLYVIFDQEKDLALTESAVWVLAKGDSKLVKFLAASDRVLANPVFGKGAFGKTQLYLAMLSVPPFTDPSARGLMRFDVGIAGQ